MPELNVVGNDQGPSWLSADGCRLYFTKADANLDLYMASR